MTEKHGVPACPLWTYEEAAEYLGVSKTFLECEVRRRRVPVVRLGRLVRFRQRDLDAWLERLAEESVDGAFSEPVVTPILSQPIRAVKKPPAGIRRITA